MNEPLRAARHGLERRIPRAPVTASPVIPQPPVTVSWPPIEQMATSARARQLRKALRRAIAKAPLGGASFSMSVADAASGESWFRHKGAKLLIPASTMKLFTSAVALDKLGPDHRFTTDIRRKKDTLYLVGNGDPVLQLEHLEQLARTAARSLQKKPIAHIVVDDSFFAGGVLPPGFDKKNTDAAYRASVGAVALHGGTAKVSVSPGREGAAPRVAISPPGRYVRIQNKALSVSGSGSTIRLHMKPDGDHSKVVVTGRIGRKRKNRPTWAVRRLEHPPLATGYAFAALLAKHCACKVTEKVTLGTAPKKSASIATHRSAPLSAVIAVMNKESNNFIAEMLLRALARKPTKPMEPVTWADGQQTVRQWTTRNLSIEPNSFAYHNGSGLYDGGLFSTDQVARLLTVMNQHKDREIYRASLAVAGQDGTLKGRLMGTATTGRMVGKTGTLNDVSALSGYVRTRNGQRLAYSILVNNTGGATRQMRKIQDRLVSILVEVR